jgi:hypothetical protein
MLYNTAKVIRMGDGDIALCGVLCEDTCLLSLDMITYLIGTLPDLSACTQS